MASTCSPSAARLRTATLGCKVNQYETEFVREGLLRAGYRDAIDDEPADLCVVNTCTVTGEADAKSRRYIRRLARRNPHARIVVMGCYAARAADEIAGLPGVAHVVRDRRDLPRMLEQFGVRDVPSGISEFAGRHRAFVKVQDGCLLRCSFCIIPQVRPGMLSRQPAAIVEEVRRLVNSGFREVVLTGIHLGHYGVDFNRALPKGEWVRLPTLMEQLLQIEETFRLRLSSIEATEVTRELIDLLAAHPQRICPHLHICVQSGSDRILRRMRRRWGAQRIADRCRMVIEQLDRPALTTDVIVGFPGEQDDDFAATCELLGEIGFSKVHAFPFSPREGTPAAEMPDQVPATLKAERMRVLADLEQEMRQRYLQRLDGATLRVLIEGASTESASDAELIGTACRYVPVHLPDGAGRPGELVEAVVHMDALGNGLRADSVSRVM